MTRARFPRFHLATILLASLAFSAFVGVNLLGRPRVTVHFKIHFVKPTPPRFPDGTVLVNPYRMPRFAFGWPTEITASPRILTSSDIIFFEDATAAEMQELKHLSQNANALYEWDSEEFQAMAPELTKRYFGGEPYLFVIPGHDLRRPRFLKLHEIRECTWNRTKIVLNAATALAITLALAAICELFLRRKNSAPRS